MVKRGVLFEVRTGFINIIKKIVSFVRLNLDKTYVIEIRRFIFNQYKHYILDDRNSIPVRGIGFFLYPLCPDQLWSPPNILSS
jgi:hypothetical protein